MCWEHSHWEGCQIDSFNVEAVDLGQLQSLQIGHDGRGYGADWLLDQARAPSPFPLPLHVHLYFDAHTEH